jgi:hypothetical protein
MLPCPKRQHCDSGSNIKAAGRKFAVCSFLWIPRLAFSCVNPEEDLGEEWDDIDEMEMAHIRALGQLLCTAMHPKRCRDAGEKQFQFNVSTVCCFRLCYTNYGLQWLAGMRGSRGTFILQLQDLGDVLFHIRTPGFRRHKERAQMAQCKELLHDNAFLYDATARDANPNDPTAGHLLHKAVIKVCYSRDRFNLFRSHNCTGYPGPPYRQEQCYQWHALGQVP